MEIIQGLIIAARLTNKDIRGSLEDNRAQFQIGDIHLDIYAGPKANVTITPTSKNMWCQPFHVEGTLESIFYAIVDIIDETAVNYEDSPCRQMFPDIECLVRFIEKETGAITNEHPEKFYEGENYIYRFDEFDIVFFGPYHGTVYVPEDYKLNFVLDEPV